MTTDKNTIDKIVNDAIADPKKSADASMTESQASEKIENTKQANVKDNSSVNTSDSNLDNDPDNNIKSSESESSEKLPLEKKTEKKESEKEEPEKKQTEPATKLSQNGNAKKSSSLSVIVLLLFVLGALMAMGYFGWLQDQKLGEIVKGDDGKFKSYETKVSTLQENVSTIKNDINRQLDDQKNTLAKVVEDNEMLRQQIAGQREQWAALTTTTNEDWKLAEAHYLTRLAGQRLIMERNTSGALALLKASDEILQKLTDPELFSVREVLAEDITALKLVQSVDREGIFLSLAAISKALVILPSPIPKNYTSEPPINKQNLAPEKGIARVKQSFDKALNSLRNYIRITKHDKPLQPLLPVDGQEYLQNSLRLTIETAQLALLKEQQQVFEESLRKASDLLNDYYSFSARAESLVGDLNQLQQLNIVQELPDITRSQNKLAAYIEKLHRLKTIDQPQALNKAAEINE